jgi:hypothetical protein
MSVPLNVFVTARLRRWDRVRVARRDVATATWWCRYAAVVVVVPAAAAGVLLGGPAVPLCAAAVAVLWWALRPQTVPVDPAGHVRVAELADAALAAHRIRRNAGWMDRADAVLTLRATRQALRSLTAAAALGSSSRAAVVARLDALDALFIASCGDDGTAEAAAALLAVSQPATVT